MMAAGMGRRADACVRRDRARCVLFVLALALIAAGMFLLNSHTPLMMDDYDYSFNWSTGERLAGLSDILASQAAHYRLWGGRSVAHFLAQLFLYLGKPVFNIANTVMYLLLLLEIYALARPRGSRSCWLIPLAAHAFLLFGVPFFGVVFLWLDGACNYLWGTALALMPLVIARSEREGGFFDGGLSRGAFALPLCFIAGWTNENTACGVLAVMLLLLLWDRLKGRPVRGWRIAAAALQALGVLVMLLAPGNFARPSGGQTRTLVMELLYRFAVVSVCVLRYAAVPALLTALVLFLARRKGWSMRMEWLCMLGACAFLSAYALVGSPQISDRSFTAVVVLALSALLAACADCRVKAHPALGAALALIVLADGCWALGDVCAHEQAWLAQVRKIEAAAEEGSADVRISSVASHSRYTMDIMIGEDASQWPNSTLSRYYGVSVYGE